MRTISTLIVLLIVNIVLQGCAPNAQERDLGKFIKIHERKVKPMMKEVNLAYWDAAKSGKSEDYEKVGELTLKIRKIYTDEFDFDFLKDKKESGQVQRAILARQLDILYNAYLENQIEPELLKKIVDLGMEIEKNFSVFRAKIAGEEVTNNQIKEILKDETDSVKKKQAWQASKQVGAVVR